MKKFSIIIPIHNRLLLTQKGIKSLNDALHYYCSNNIRRLVFSVIVVDDGSTDGSAQWVTKNHPDIHLLRGNGNLWWTGAINKGARYAVQQLESDFIILWNDDTVCDITYFIEIEKLLTNNVVYQTSILASKIFWLNEADTLFNYGCYYSHKSGKKQIIGLDKVDSEEYSKAIPIDWAGGMGTIIPADTITELNYFDEENFPQYHADIDFFLRAKKHGYNAYAIPTLKIYNNRASTGLSKTKTLKDLKNLFLSNRSNYNIKHNYIFNRRHSNTVFGWLYFMFRYAALTSNSLRTIVCR